MDTNIGLLILMVIGGGAGVITSLYLSQASICSSASRRSSSGRSTGNSAMDTN